LLAIMCLALPVYVPLLPSFFIRSKYSGKL